MGYPSKFAGFFNAGEFAYGINKTTPALQVVNGPNTTVGAQALTLAFGYTQTNDGLVFNPLNTNAPITVGGGSSTETITPSAVSASTPTQFSTTTVTGTFANLHGNGDSIRSGTVGLQEAINYAQSLGGGTVVVDAGWTLLGGTTALIQAATWPLSVTLQDNRPGGQGPGQSNLVLTNAQILLLSSTAVQLLPAPGVGAFYNILKMTMVNENAGTAFTGGGALTVGYGPANNLTQALSGTIAASFLTTPTAVQVIQLAGVNLASSSESIYDNQPIYISATTANFAAGTGATLRVSLDYTVVNK